jgi:hypothetical protein
VAVDEPGPRDRDLATLVPALSGCTALSGLLPILFAALVVSALLWGTGQELPFVGGEFEPTTGATDGREATAWLAGVAIALLVSYPVLRELVRLLQGKEARWVPQIALRYATRRQERRREWVPRITVERYPRYPMHSALRPTALGNVRAALAERIADRYGGDLAVLWPRLLALVPENERRDLASARRSAELPLYLGVGWFIAAAGAAVTCVFYLRASPLLLGLVAGSLVLGRSAHRVAVAAGIEHAQRVESTFDVHRHSLLDAVGWRRPADDEEELQMFRTLSLLLAGHDSAADKYRQRGPEGDAGDVVEYLRHSIDATVEASLRPAVESTLRDAVAGPRFANFDGYVSAQVLRDGVQVGLEEQTVLMTPRDYHELRVVIGTKPEPSAVSVPLRVRGGDDLGTVPFAVAVDSNVAAWRKAGSDLEVARHGPPATLDLPLDAPVSLPDGPLWLWVRVSQRGRTLQNLELDVRMAARHPGSA